MPPNLTTDLAAKIGCQKNEIQRIHKDLQTTLDSLNSLDEVNLNSVQGGCVDESIASDESSTSCWG